MLQLAVVTLASAETVRFLPPQEPDYRRHAFTLTCLGCAVSGEVPCVWPSAGLANPGLRHFASSVFFGVLCRRGAEHSCETTPHRLSPETAFFGISYSSCNTPTGVCGLSLAQAFSDSFHVLAFSLPSGSREVGRGLELAADATVDIRALLQHQALSGLTLCLGARARGAA